MKSLLMVLGGLTVSAVNLLCALGALGGFVQTLLLAPLLFVVHAAYARFGRLKTALFNIVVLTLGVVIGPAAEIHRVDVLVIVIATCWVLAVGSVGLSLCAGFRARRQHA
jgi:hypothetical protein